MNISIPGYEATVKANKYGVFIYIARAFAGRVMTKFDGKLHTKFILISRAGEGEVNFMKTMNASRVVQMHAGTDTDIIVLYILIVS